jgi:adenylate cyclase
LKIEDLFKARNIIDLSFFNFRNAITAAFFASTDLEILRINENFRKFFPVLGNVSNAYFPDVLEQLGLPDEQIDEFVKGLNEKGTVLIPHIEIRTGDETRVFSLLSARTKDNNFSYLNGLQGQFVDRTEETLLRKEREELLDERIRNQDLIEEKSQQLETLANRLAKYLSPQIYESIFSNVQSDVGKHKRRNLTVFFSDIEQFTDLSDTLEPERLARVINNYLSEMTTIAIDCGGTIDKFVGDAMMVFFGDPSTEGESRDALKCVEMAARMRQRVLELRDHWRRLGVPDEMNVRMGIATGYCTVGDFWLGSTVRLYRAG